jgi:hypothetical protein
MNTKNSRSLLLLVMITIFAVGCKDDDLEPLSFYGNSYEVPVRGARYIGIKSGSGDYSLQVENTKLLSASKEEGWSNPAGMFLVRGLLTGETTLTVIDNRTAERCNLHIKVTDNYEVLRVSATIKNEDPSLKDEHPFFSQTPYLFLVNNRERDVYFADRKGEQTITENGIRIKGKGSYTLVMEAGNPYLELIYATNEDGQLTDDASVAPTSHKFRITRSSEFLLHYLDENLNLGWDTPSGSYSAEQMFLTLEMEEDGSGSQITGKFYTEDTTIPTGLLN